MAPIPPTVIHRFVELALAADTAQTPAVDCAGDTLTYSKLLALASSLSLELAPGAEERRPVIAIISKNHPYTLSIIIAAWLIGAIAAPLDAHAPEPLLRGMLEVVAPSIVVLPEGVELSHRICKGAYFFFA